MVWFGLSAMLHDDWRAAALPLFAEGLVDALEWSFDATPSAAPTWLSALLDAYADEGRLFGHGVSFSLLASDQDARRRRYLDRLAAELAARPHRLVSEHLGFAAAGDFVDSAPLPQPWTTGALALARANLEQLEAVTAAAGVPLGLENLALAGSPADARGQAAFLSHLLAPTGPDPDPPPFLLLDLHNLWSQSRNTGLPVAALLDALPLPQVRELHVSGGSWSTPRCRPEAPFRRDTHDGDVPADVLGLLPLALARCPAVEVVIFERLGGTLGDPAAAARFQADARRIRALLDAPPPPTAPPAPPPDLDPAEPAPAAAQAALLEFLHASRAPHLELPQALADDPNLAPYAAWLASWEPAALEVAADLVRRWGRRATTRPS